MVVFITKIPVHEYVDLFKTRTPILLIQKKKLGWKDDSVLEGQAQNQKDRKNVFVLRNSSMIEGWRESSVNKACAVQA